MKRFLSVLLMSLVCILPLQGAAASSIERARRASIQFGQENETEGTGGFCSATAIGPHAILTAAHCQIKGTDVIFVRGANDLPILGTIAERIEDGNDHVIYLIPDIAFVHYVTVKLNVVLYVSKPVFTWGNPGGWHDYFQRGSVSGALGDKFVLYSFQTYAGASGSGIFDVLGNLVDVVSADVVQTGEGERAAMSISATAAKPLAFKQADINRAVTFTGK